MAFYSELAMIETNESGSCVCIYKLFLSLLVLGTETARSDEHYVW